MKQAFRIGAVKAIRTFAQTAAGALSTLTVVSLARPDLLALGNAAAVGIIVAALAAVVAFLQNFAEALPE